MLKFWIFFCFKLWVVEFVALDLNFTALELFQNLKNTKHKVVEKLIFKANIFWDVALDYFIKTWLIWFYWCRKNWSCVKYSQTITNHSFKVKIIQNLKQIQQHNTLKQLNIKRAKKEKNDKTITYRTYWWSSRLLFIKFPSVKFQKMPK